MNRWITVDSTKLKDLIDEQDLKFWWLAEMAGIHKSTLRRWLAREHVRVSEEKMERVTRVLNVPLSRVT